MHYDISKLTDSVCLDQSSEFFDSFNSLPGHLCILSDFNIYYDLSSSVQFSSSTDWVVRGVGVGVGGIMNDLADILFKSFLQEAVVSSSGKEGADSVATCGWGWWVGVGDLEYERAEADGESEPEADGEPEA